ncbi:hypothetical protein C5467_09545 [Photorhabdus khanii subsp. guanajuatensis]|uniref:Uncharacterized protein n=1 Tax=Photorhabdus khanii subsp. guanajuatensis TaxID=2100166 RepID=A0A4R4JYL3_9GAMM|nr:hypothetical protein C5467_09545 [Photorhabdus khanii subsp. guanajuatensis]
MREYIAQDNPTAALAIDELFSEEAGRLIDHPFIGRLVREVPEPESNSGSLYM